MRRQNGDPFGRNSGRLQGEPGGGRRRTGKAGPLVHYDRAVRPCSRSTVQADVAVENVPFWADGRAPNLPTAGRKGRRYDGREPGSHAADSPHKKPVLFLPS